MITKININEKTRIKDLVNDNFEAAIVFEKYRIDFYCRGNRTLTTAAEEQKINVGELISELQMAQTNAEVKSDKFDSWTLVLLTNYIVDNHHSYVKEAMPRIQKLLDKTLMEYKRTHLFLITIDNLFKSISSELFNHMSKEEKIVFHIVNYLEGCKVYKEKPKIRGYGTIKNSINTMENEHAGSVEVMSEIRKLTTNFVLPDDASEILVLTYKELEEFEHDLHKHIHLENNILFPKAIKLEEELLKL